MTEANYAARDAGVESNLAKADRDSGEFKRWAEWALMKHIRSGLPFSAEHVRRDIPEDVQAHHHNVLPSLFSQAAKRGEIVQVGDAHTQRVSRHGSRNKMWVGAKYGATSASNEMALLRRSLQAIALTLGNWEKQCTNARTDAWDNGAMTIVKAVKEHLPKEMK